MGIPQIAEATGWASTTVGSALRDPLGVDTERRKQKGARKCLDCDRLCNTDGRVSEPAVRCKACARRHQEAEAKWQPEVIIAALHRWAELYGEPPAASDWNMGMATPEGCAAFYAGDYPHVTEVLRRFGSWNNALEAAGYERRKTGSYRRKRRPFRVPAKLKPEDVLQREIEKLRAKQAGHKAAIVEIDKDVERYEAAQAVLKGAA